MSFIVLLWILKPLSGGLFHSDFRLSVVDFTTTAVSPADVEFVATFVPQTKVRTEQWLPVPRPVRQEIQLETSFVDPLAVEEKGTFSRVRKIELKRGHDALASALFEYDRYGQLERLHVLRAQGSENEAWPDQPVDLGNGRSFHMAYSPTQAPRLWIQSLGHPDWVFSGYDLMETIVRTQGGMVEESHSYVTISHFHQADGRVMPALESFDHDDIVSFADQVNLPYLEASIINDDYHPDDRPDYDPLTIANWATYFKKACGLLEMIWLKPFVSPFKAWSKEVIDVEVEEADSLTPKGRAILLTNDGDALATGRPGPVMDMRKRQEGVMAVYRAHPEWNFVGVHFVRSAYSRRTPTDHAPREQSNFILNLQISLYQPIFGEVQLRRISQFSRKEYPNPETRHLIRNHSHMMRSRPWWPKLAAEA